MKAISGHTRAFGLLGHPVRHTLSPAMHNAAFEALGMDAVYLAFDVPPERVMVTLEALAGLGCGGINLTVPLKEVAFQGLTDLDDSARLLGAVNTVQFTPGGMRGYNTDGIGFAQAIEEAFGAGIKGWKVFVLGCGGAGRAVALTCARQGARRIALADADLARAQRLAVEISAAAPSITVETSGANPDTWSQVAQASDLVIQATPLGMHAGDQSPLPQESFRRGQMVFDLVYNVPDTDCVRRALAGGARAVNGLGMLLHQGTAALTIWTGKPAPVDVMRKTLEEALYAPKS